MNAVNFLWPEALWLLALLPVLLILYVWLLRRKRLWRGRQPCRKSGADHHEA